MKLVCSVCNEIKEFNREEMKEFFNLISKLDNKIKASEYPRLYSMLNERTCYNHKKHVYIFSQDTTRVIENLIYQHENFMKNERLMLLDNDNIDLTIENANKTIEDANKRRDKYNERKIKLNDIKEKMDDKMMDVLGSDDYSILSYSNEEEDELIEDELKKLDELIENENEEIE